MKKFILLLLMIFLVGCSINEEKKTDNKQSEITVTTSFLQDMVQVLVGDEKNVSVIIPAGEDPHLYIAKPNDFKKINDSELVVYHGLHFEGKMVDVLEQTAKSITDNFDKGQLGTIEEDGEVQIDPHFWFNLTLYKKAFENMKDILAIKYPELKENITKNYDRYVLELEKLDSYIKDRVSELDEKKRVLITPHDAFNYFAKSYGFQVMAPQGISTDSEVANSEIEKTAKFIADNKIKAIFAESTTNPERMVKLQQIVKSKGFDVKVVSGEGNELFSDSLAPKGEKGDTFIDMYKHNIDLIVNNLKD